MSFRFYQPDDAESIADAPGELPADLAALGEQLQADAQRLGDVYPACRAPSLTLPARTSKGESFERRDFNRNLIFAVSASAALLFIAACIQLTWLPPANTAASVPAAVGTETTMGQAADLANAPSASALQPVSFRPAVGDMNGPELEGLLDLLDDQPQAAAVISF